MQPLLASTINFHMQCWSTTHALHSERCCCHNAQTIMYLHTASTSSYEAVSKPTERPTKATTVSVKINNQTKEVPAKIKQLTTEQTTQGRQLNQLMSSFAMTLPSCIDHPIQDACMCSCSLQLKMKLPTSGS